MWCVGFILIGTASLHPVNGTVCHVYHSLAARTPDSNYSVDDFFLQKGLETELIFTLPERLAEGAKTFIGA